MRKPQDQAEPFESTPPSEKRKNNSKRRSPNRYGLLPRQAMAMLSADGSVRLSMADEHPSIINGSGSGGFLTSKAVLNGIRRVRADQVRPKSPPPPYSEVIADKARMAIDENTPTVLIEETSSAESIPLLVLHLIDMCRKLETRIHSKTTTIRITMSMAKIPYASSHLLKCRK